MNAASSRPTANAKTKASKPKVETAKESKDKSSVKPATSGSKSPKLAAPVTSVPPVRLREKTTVEPASSSRAPGKGKDKVQVLWWHWLAVKSDPNIVGGILKK